MIINKVLIGNVNEAFIEEGFTNGLNIISSDDNNKGKTIVIQSLMYALGNEPIFPDSFDYKDYFHIVEITTDKREKVDICRKKNSFTVLLKGNLNTFDRVTEFKYFLNKSIFKLPSIIKDGSKKLVDPVLFFQMFFVGQDNKDTSNIFLHGYYNKKDFMNMLASYIEIGNLENDEIDIEKLKVKLKQLKIQKSEILKQNKILKSILPAVKIGSVSNNKKNFENKLRDIDKLKNNIIDLSVNRNKAISRKLKNEVILKELKSLNQTLQVGTLKCLDCDSENIGFSSANNSSTFDISSIDIRKQIISSIEEKIQMYEEEIKIFSSEIEKKQIELKLVLSEEDVNIESLLLYKSDLVDSSEADLKLIEIDKEIENINLNLSINENLSEKDLNLRKTFFEKIYNKMNEFYEKIDPESNRVFQSLFSTQQSVYSGVEATEFFLSKLYALQSEIKHSFPIIMDYFRDGELSSLKEKLVIEIFSELSNQIIFTATLKDQELNKYRDFKEINNIDYKSHLPYKLLNQEDILKFKEAIAKFSLNLA